MNHSLKWRIAQFFEILWWKNYLKNKNPGAYLTWKQNYWGNILGRIKDEFVPVKGLQVLDAGCGPAGIFMALEPCDVTAIDPLLNKYRNNLAHFNPDKYPYVKFKNVALESFADHEKFDVVFCLNAINHVADLNIALKNLYNSTKKGGYMAVSIDAHNYTFFKHLFRLMPGDILHPHQYDLKDYEQMLTHLGCLILKKLLIKREFLFDHYLLMAKKN